MPKMKTTRAARMRFKVSGTGKIIARHSKNTHFMRRKSASAKRRLDKDQVLAPCEAKKIRRLVPYGL